MQNKIEVTKQKTLDRVNKNKTEHEKIRMLQNLLIKENLAKRHKIKPKSRHWPKKITVLGSKWNKEEFTKKTCYVLTLLLCCSMKTSSIVTIICLCHACSEIIELQNPILPIYLGNAKIATH